MRFQDCLSQVVEHGANYPARGMWECVMYGNGLCALCVMYGMDYVQMEHRIES